MRLAAATTILSLALATLAHGHGSHDDRVARFLEVIRQDPDDVNARHDLARAYVEHGDWKLALAELDAADRMNPPDSGLDFSMTRARALVAGGHLDDARRVLDAFLEKHPGHGSALLERARVLASLKQVDQSLADYRKTLRLVVDPEPDLFIEVADHLVKAGLNEEAISVMRTSLETKGQVPSLMLKTMDLEIAAGRFDDALLRVDAMAKRMPRPEPWMAKRASVLARAGRVDESRREWQALLDHLQALPAQERRSAAMTNLATEARQAVAELEN